MDANTKAIAEVLRRWHASEPLPPGVTPIDRGVEYRRARERREWMHKFTRPFPGDAA